MSLFTWNVNIPMPIPMTDPIANMKTANTNLGIDLLAPANSKPKQKPTTNLCDATAPVSNSTWKNIATCVIESRNQLNNHKERDQRIYLGDFRLQPNRKPFEDSVHGESQGETGEAGVAVGALLSEISMT